MPGVPERLRAATSSCCSAEGIEQVALLDYLGQMQETFPAKDISDYLPLRLMGPEGILPVVKRLLSIGYAEVDMRAILGGNWQRIARQVWR
jgi:microsomal dipeptidase-like Zn-dependent dipeptidase